MLFVLVADRQVGIFGEVKPIKNRAVGAAVEVVEAQQLGGEKSIAHKTMAHIGPVCVVELQFVGVQNQASPRHFGAAAWRGLGLVSIRLRAAGRALVHSELLLHMLARFLGR